MPASTSSTTSPTRVPHVGLELPAAGGGSWTRRPPAAPIAPTCSGCGRSTPAAPGPAGSGCAARWCARTWPARRSRRTASRRSRSAVTRACRSAPAPSLSCRDDHGLQARLPRPQPVSSLHVDIVEARPQQLDELVDVRFAEIGCRGHTHPRHVAGSAARGRPAGNCRRPARRASCGATSIFDTTPITRSVCWAARSISAQSDSVDRSDRGHHEHDRGGCVGGPDVLGLDEVVLGQPIPQARRSGWSCLPATGR